MKNLKMSMSALLLAFLTVMSSACGGNVNTEETTGASETSAESAEVSTAEGTSSEVTTEAPAPETKTVTVTSSDAGFTLYGTRTDSKLVSCELSDAGDAVITVLAEGTADVTLFNSYAETATVHLVIGSDLSASVKIDKYEAPKNVYMATDYGAKDGGDVTSALQTCIDKAHEAGGGTIYLPLGSYKVGTLSMKSGAILRLEGFVPDARVGYSAQVKKLVATKKITSMTSNGSLSGNFFFLNVIPKSYCTAGESDFTVSGGIWQCNATVKLVGMACGSNIVFENLIVKDNPNNHAFQIEGCSNVLVQNIMFAGYKYTSDSVLTRETIQLEPTTQGAIGSDYANNVIQCDPGDFHHCSNVKVNGCYFGKSDNYGSQLVAVGHHSYTGGLVCDGFEFTNNVVDNPLYCGLHLPDYLNVKISGNTFISTSKATTAILADDSALISLYGFVKDCTYTVNGKKIYAYYSYELPGTQYFEIYDNTFELGGNTFLRAMYIAGATANYNYAQFVNNSSQYRVTAYGATPTAMNGYVLMVNCANDISIHNNSFTFKSAASYKNYYSLFKYVNGLKYADNTVTLADGVSFSASADGVAGVKYISCVTDNNQYTRKVSIPMYATKTVTVVAGGNKTVIPNPTSGTSMYIFKTDGNGYIDLQVDEKGNLTVNVIPFEGHTFKNFTDSNGSECELNKQALGSVVVTANFN